MRLRNTRFLPSLLLLALSVPALAIVAIEEFNAWAFEIGLFPYWNWVYNSSGGTDLVGAMLDENGFVHQDSFFDDADGSFIDGNVYPTPLDFNDWYDEIIAPAGGPGGGSSPPEGDSSGSGSSSGGGTSSSGSGGSCIVMTDCLIASEGKFEGNHMNTLQKTGLLMAASLSVAAPASPTSPENDIHRFLAALHKNSHLSELRFLEGAVNHPPTDETAETVVLGLLEPLNLTDALDESRLTVRCSRFACQLSFYPLPETNLFGLADRVANSISNSSDIAFLGVVPTARDPEDHGLIHAFLLRDSFQQLLTKTE
ncbi:MAG: hypothetical protein R3217_07910 [Gammaproteobacteria bacterium]|nr:hypothetical protein [Gammaproteobacteria bacterium]